MAAKLSILDRETKGLKWFPLFTLMGWILIGFSICDLGKDVMAIWSTELNPGGA